MSEGKQYEFELKLSNDYYEAYLTIHNFGEKDFKVTPEEIIDFLKSKNVVFGIDLDVIDTICQNPLLANGRLIAKGISHCNGENGYITFNFDNENEKKPTMLANGNVDFKNLNIVHIAKKGDLLAEKTDPTEGVTGTTVTGKSIRQKPGKAVNFKMGKNVYVSEDGSKLYAAVDGTINFEDGKVSVIEVLDIRGDVGVKTGNINFVGKVVVFGNITTGYEVQCEELEVNGLIEQAKVNCSGNVTVSAGIQGNDVAEIYCGGNFKSSMINNCHLKVKGDILCDTIMHSTIICDGEIRAAGKKGLIVGGDVSARRAIRANTIGSEMGTSTSLKLGMDSTIIEEFKEINDQMKELRDQNTKLEQLMRLLTKNLQADPTNLDLKDKVDKLVPVRNQNTDALMQLQTRLMEYTEMMNQLGDAFVSANTLYSGVKIKIGNSYYNVKHELKGVKLIREEGHVVAIPN